MSSGTKRKMNVSRGRLVLSIKHNVTTRRIRATGARQAEMPNTSHRICRDARPTNLQRSGRVVNEKRKEQAVGALKRSVTRRRVRHYVPAPGKRYKRRVPQEKRGCLI
jgi:hypothetical protein